VKPRSIISDGTAESMWVKFGKLTVGGINVKH